MSRFNLIYILQYNAIFLKTTLALWMKTNILKIYHMWPYEDNQKKTNVDVVDTLLMCVLGLPSLTIILLIMIPL